MPTLATPIVKPTERHPLAGKRMTGADMVVQVLADEGVEVLFGYSGGAILPTYDAVFRYNVANGPPDAEWQDQPMLLVVPANEQGAGFMASGYARASSSLLFSTDLGTAPTTWSMGCPSLKISSVGIPLIP